MRPICPVRALSCRLVRPRFQMQQGCDVPSVARCSPLLSRPNPSVPKGVKQCLVFLRSQFRSQMYRRASIVFVAQKRRMLQAAAVRSTFQTRGAAAAAHASVAGADAACCRRRKARAWLWSRQIRFASLDTLLLQCCDFVQCKVGCRCRYGRAPQAPRRRKQRKPWVVPIDRLGSAGGHPPAPDAASTFCDDITCFTPNFSDHCSAETATTFKMGYTSIVESPLKHSRHAGPTHDECGQPYDEPSRRVFLSMQGRLLQPGDKETVCTQDLEITLHVVLTSVPFRMDICKTRSSE